MGGVLESRGGVMEMELELELELSMGLGTCAPGVIDVCDCLNC